MVLSLEPYILFVMEGQKTQTQMILVRAASTQQGHANQEHQLYIFNEPIEHIDKQLIVSDEFSGCCVVYKRDYYIISTPPNFNSPTKRSFLNECIRQLYLMNGLTLTHQVLWPSSATQTTPQERWLQVDLCLRLSKLSPRRAGLLNVKRQLFRETRHTRKCKIPVQCTVEDNETQLIHFKHWRLKIEGKRIRRGYLNMGRRMVINQLICENLKREMLCTSAASKTLIDATRNIHMAQRGSVIRPRTKSVDTMLLQQSVRRTVHNQQLLMEQSVRSIYYAKHLFRFIENEDNPLYKDN